MDLKFGYQLSEVHMVLYNAIKPSPLLPQLKTLLTLNKSLSTGKVHGSLARAGKVKGQTPKVRIYFGVI